MTQRTVTLDDDVSALLDKEAQRKGVPADEVLNEKLRRVLEAESDAPTGRRFVIRGPFLRAREGITFDDIDALLDETEGPWRR